MATQNKAAANREKREQEARFRAEIIGHLKELEKEYGVPLVNAAISRHQQVRRERAKLVRAEAEIKQKIAKLEGRE